MTARNDDRLLRDWLHDVAPAHEPELLLGQVLARTARTRRRPAWRIPERWISMSAITSRLAPSPSAPWRMLLVAAALLLALAVGLATLSGSWAPPPAPPYGLAANGQIAFAIDGDIVVVDSPTSAPRTLISGEASDGLPFYSPDGTEISFLRGPEDAVEIWVAKADGSAAHRIAGPFDRIPGWAEWSPDGDLFVTSGTAEEPGDITVTRTDGSGSRTISTGLRSAQVPAFRPTAGNQLAFRGFNEERDWGYYVVNLDGSGLRHLALDPGFQQDEFYNENRWYYFQGMSWDSTGNRLIFHTLEPDPDSPAGPGFRIHVAHVDHAGAVLTERVLEFDSTTDDEFAATFIPGTDEIIYNQVEGQTHTLMRGSVGPAAGPGAPVSAGPVQANEFIGVVHSPDGRQVIAFVPDGDAPKLLLIDLATRGTTDLDLPPDLSWQRRGM